MVFVENGTVFVISGRTDAAQRAFCQRRFEQVRRIHCAAAGTACADDGVDFVNKQDGVRDFFELFQDGLDPSFKVAAVFRASQKRTHIQRVHFGIFQRVGNVAVDDLMCQTFCQRGFAYASLADQKRIVFAAAAQDLHQPFHFMFATNQRVDTAGFDFGVEVDGVVGKRAGFLFRFFALASQAV